MVFMRPSYCTKWPLLYIISSSLKCEIQNVSIGWGNFQTNSDDMIWNKRSS